MITRACIRACLLCATTIGCGESSTLTRWKPPDPALAPPSTPVVTSNDAPPPPSPTPAVPAPSSDTPALAGATGDGSRATSDDCAKMIDHYLELMIRSAPGMEGASSDELAAAKDMAREAVGADPSYQKAAAQCRSDVKRAQYDCAMRAMTTAAWQACVK